MTGKNDKGLLASVKSSSYRTDGTVKVGVGSMPTAACKRGFYSDISRAGEYMQQWK